MRLARALIGAALVSVGVAAPVARASQPDCSPPEGGFAVVVEDAVYRNRHGEAIAVDVHRPAAEQGCRFPVVLESSPYRDWMAPEPVDALTEDERRAWWVRQGYVFAFADVPGSGRSEGTWCMFCTREQQSGYDMVEALAAAPWSSGKVGLIGGSYPAINALLIAQLDPPHLEAVIAAAFTADLYDDLLWPGGMRRGEDALAIGGVFSYIDALGGHAPDGRFLTMQDDHPFDDEWYAERRLRPEEVRVPVYVLGGWNDIFDRSTWETFDRLGTPDDRKFLRQGPFTHVPVMVQSDAWPCESHASDFCGAPVFDRFLKGEHTDAYEALRRNPVQTYVEPFAGWMVGTRKPATTPWTMTLGSPGSTGVVRGDPTAGATGGRWFARGSVPGTFVPYDHWLGIDGPPDQRVEEAKIVSIASPVLTEDVTVVGGGTLSLLVKPSVGDDADIAVRIVDEWPVGSAQHPEGYAYRVGGGWLRASHRDGHGAADVAPLAAGEWIRLEVDLWPIGYRFAAGHRIRIDVAGADVPRFAPPPAPFELVVDLASSAVTLPRVAG